MDHAYEEDQEIGVERALHLDELVMRARPV